MSEFLSSTISLCKECARRVQARIQVENSGVWLYKVCPEHGQQKALVYSSLEEYLNVRDYYTPGSIPLYFSASGERGCPDSCGLCPEHEQHVCMPVIEITDHCDMACPICLVKNPRTRHLSRTDVVGILDTLIRNEGQIDVANLSGGEPTENPNFRAIVEECLSRKEILRVSVSTNGLNLMRDEGLLKFLAERNVVISLQFDGFVENAYQTLRGRPLFAEKMRLIDKVSSLGAPMSLTVTVARGVNDRGLEQVVELLFSRPNILSVMFQPAVYAAHNHSKERPENAVTIPDIVFELDGAAKGMVKASNFSPLPCSHPACFALAFYLKVDDTEFVSLKGMINMNRYVGMIRNRGLFGTDLESFRHTQDAIYDLWSGPCALTPDCQKALGAAKKLISVATGGGGEFKPAKALVAAERHVKSIFIHQFMDRDTFDLSRVRKCCTVYPQTDGRSIPCCVHNCLTRR